MKLLPPSTNCLLCGHVHSGKRGKRLFAQHVRMITVTDEVTFPKINKPKGSRIESSIDPAGDQLFVVAHGEPAQEEIFVRALEQVKTGRHPWFCQKCSSQWCEDCDTPWEFPMGADFLTDDGSKLHVPGCPIGRACRNSECKALKA